jgi:hypothetical protein
MERGMKNIVINHENYINHHHYKQNVFAEAVKWPVTPLGSVEHN